MLGSKFRCGPWPCLHPDIARCLRTGGLMHHLGDQNYKGHATNKKNIWMWIIRPYQAQAARLWSPAGWWAATNPASQHDGQIMVSVPWLIPACTKQRLGISDRLSTCGKQLHQQTNRLTQPSLSWVPGKDGERFIGDSRFTHKLGRVWPCGSMGTQIWGRHITQLPTGSHGT